MAPPFRTAWARQRQEPVGPVTCVDCDVGGMAVTAVCGPDTAPVISAQIGLGFSSSRVYLFDPASEQRVQCPIPCI